MTDPLLTLAQAKEVTIETIDGDRTYRAVIWTVAVADTIYVRSYLGDSGKWYQRTLVNPEVALSVGDQRMDFTAEPVTDEATITAVSEAFVAKYQPGRSRNAMVAPEVLHTTLRLTPVESR